MIDLKERFELIAIAKPYNIGHDGVIDYLVATFDNYPSVGIIELHAKEWKENHSRHKVKGFYVRKIHVFDDGEV